MKLACIAAAGKNGELGYQGDMPWKRSLKKDLAFFRETTLHHPVVMGRKTWQSLGKALPGRENVVISSQPVKDPNVTWFDSLESFLRNRGDDKNLYFVIGGASIYQQLLDQSELIYLTEIDQEFEADCFFPEFDRALYSCEILDQQEENGLNYKHIKYKRLIQPD